MSNSAPPAPATDAIPEPIPADHDVSIEELWLYYEEGR